MAKDDNIVPLFPKKKHEGLVHPDILNYARKLGWGNPKDKDDDDNNIIKD